MNNPHLDQAREWASRIKSEFVLPTRFNEKTLDAAEVIQSLPDQWIDAEKVAELADDMANWSLPDMPSTTGDDCRRLIELLGGFADRINDLLTPPLQTLAELIEAGNDPKQYQWMACEVKEPDSAPSKGHITFLSGGFSYVLFPSGISGTFADNHITPHPDLPRLEWPAQEPRNPETPPAETLNNPSSDTPRNSRPEDVPAGEAWLVNTREGEQREALKAGNRWYVKDGDDVEEWVEEALTPIARLVPEVAP